MSKRSKRALSGALLGLPEWIVQVATYCGCDQAVGFEACAKTVITLNGIEPWAAKELIKNQMKTQQALAKRSPLRYVPIEEGLQYFAKYAGNNSWSHNISRERFVQIALDLISAKGISHTHKEREELNAIFDSLDYDKNGSLSVGEWAGGLTVFFQGTQEKAVHAVFTALDRDGSKSLSKNELQEYFRPFVKAMTPPEAESLRPLLLRKATDDIYKEMDLDKNCLVTSDEMWEWTSRGNSILDRLTDIIDKEVFKIWSDVKQKEKSPSHKHHHKHGQASRQEQLSSVPQQSNPSTQTRGIAPSFAGNSFGNSMDLRSRPHDGHTHSSRGGGDSHHMTMESTGRQSHTHSDVHQMVGRSRAYHPGLQSHVESEPQHFRFGSSLSSWGHSGDHDQYSQSPSKHRQGVSGQRAPYTHPSRVLPSCESKGPPRNAPYELYGRDNSRSVPAPPPAPYREQHGVQSPFTKSSDYGPPPPRDHMDARSPSSVFSGMFGG